MDKEDGEMSDDNIMLVDDVDNDPVHSVPKTNITTEDCTVLYKAEKNGLIVKKLEKADAAKLEERAKRFGLNLTGNRVITQRQIDELYSNFGIESGNERHFRFDALHLNGVDGLTTKEIFEYLEDYKPISLEWIDNVSCNVVCQDHISAALALLVHSREIQNEDMKKMLADKSNHHWREGMPHPKQDLVLIRFATNGDKKKLNKKTATVKYLDEYFDRTMDSASKNPWGDLCKSWGVYDHQEVFQRKLPKNDYENEIDEVEEPRKPIQIRNKKLAMRLGKRKQDNVEPSDESSSDSEWKSKSKAPRMRMHADDEESKLKKMVSKPIKPLEQDKHEKYAPLSIEVVNSQTTYVKKEHTKLSDKFKFHGGNNKSSIQSRLGDKISPLDKNSSQSEASDDSSDEDSDHNMMSKVQKVGSKPSTTGSVWSRLETQQRQSSAQSDLRQILKSRTKQNNPEKKQSNDLRDRLGKSKHDNLRIEIDNNHYSDDDDDEDDE